MKNRTLLTLIAVALAMNSFAQTEKGRLTIEPHVGMTIANFVGSSSTGSTGQIGFMGGFDFQYGISERLSFSIGANYAQYGARDHGK
ncbi:MAG: outer membrane beta-barrel protein, partial [Prevotella sp.]|nr:outer membrane beta-barrel protein [Prevotella sp.]